ncbi:MAG: tagaturonate epimerase family protein [bacterium]|nr:tagaturonate epimerase family protein [bacterium]
MNIDRTNSAKYRASLAAVTGMDIYSASVMEAGGLIWAMGSKDFEKFLLISTTCGCGCGLLPDFEGSGVCGEGMAVKVCALTHDNAVALRKALPFTAPQLVGLSRSVGCGDRLGVATPGHIRAARGSGFVPILAQQSIREMERTGRTPENVIDDATWGIMQEGYTDGYGSDADHLKQPEYIDSCLAAGFTLFTVDPGDHVDNAAHGYDDAELEARFVKLPFADLGITADAMKAAYEGKEFDLGQSVLSFDHHSLLKAAVKYSGAVLHTVGMYRHLVEAAAGRPYELEVSVDETETPTTALEHIFIASELKRLGVEWVSLAPRFVGRFEKGVDYIGDLSEFEARFAEHAAIAKLLGGYKISLHSGSDKFSIYPIVARYTGKLVHLKTAGTSYLEAVRVVAACDPALFREIFAFAYDRYETDKATYHVSAYMERVPDISGMDDKDLPGLLDHFDVRQMLHVTFGSVLTTVKPEGGLLFRDRFMDVLRRNEELHYETLAAHMKHHLELFG